jgi:N-acetylneuraminic acid mutarotase
VADPTYQITNDIFSYNSKKQAWNIVLSKNNKNIPSPRAAHGATAIDNHQVVIFGGAQSQGKVVDNNLYLLKLMKDETLGQWVKVPVEQPKPLSRYGHTMAYIKPFILLIGGTIGIFLISLLFLFYKFPEIRNT